MFSRCRRVFTQWLASANIAVTLIKLPIGRRVSTATWCGSNEWDDDPTAIDKAREYLQADKVISFSISLARNILGELTKPIHKTVTDIQEAVFYVENPVEGSSLQLRNINIRMLAILAEHDVLQVHISNCWIDELLFDSRNSKNEIELTLENTWIGRFDLSRANFRSV